MASPVSSDLSSRDSVADGPTRRGGFSMMDWAFVGFIIVAAAIAYLPAMRGAFLWDDIDWMNAAGSQFSDWRGLWKMWASPTALQQYYPLAGTSFWLDHHFWGFWTTPYHVENVLWHALAALLFWRLLEKLEVPGAKLAAAIFALHPVMVESVGWITERKNVLSMVLFLGALLAYGRHCGFWKADDALCPRRGAYAAALALFMAGLLAKITAFVFPPAVLLLGWWKRGRIRLKQDVLPTLPFFVCAVGLGYFISWLEKHHVGAGAELTLPQRLLVAGRAPWFYAAKVLWPADVCFVYPRWNLDAHSVVQWLVVAASALVPVALWVFRERLGRGLIAAILFFVGCLFPVLGLFDVYGMHFTFVADRWVYFSSLGLIAVVACGVHRVLRSSRGWTHYAVAAVLLGPLMMLTWRHSALLKDGETLWMATIQQNPTSWMPWNELGGVQFEKKRFPEAFACFQKSVELEPRLADARVNLASSYEKLGRLDDAIREYHKALSIMPPTTASGIVASAYYNLAGTLQRKGRIDEAIVNYQKAVAANDEFITAHVLLGHALFGQGRLDEALVQYRRVLELRPGNGNDFGCVANVLNQQGHLAEAATYYDAALQVDPGNVVALNNYSRLLASSPDKAVRDGAKAVELARRLNQRTQGQNPAAIATLATAYAACGKFADALRSLEQAQTIASSQGDSDLVESLQGQRKLIEDERQ